MDTPRFSLSQVYEPSTMALSPPPLQDHAATQLFLLPFPSLPTSSRRVDDDSKGGRSLPPFLLCFLLFLKPSTMAPSSLMLRFQIYAAMARSPLCLSIRTSSTRQRLNDTTLKATTNASRASCSDCSTSCENPDMERRWNQEEARSSSMATTHRLYHVNRAEASLHEKKPTRSVEGLETERR